MLRMTEDYHHEQREVGDDEKMILHNDLSV